MRTLFNDTTTTEIYTLSLHDALPIFDGTDDRSTSVVRQSLKHIKWLANKRALKHIVLHSFTHLGGDTASPAFAESDRKSTRLNSSHSQISYAVFCLKKKNTSTHSDRR